MIDTNTSTISRFSEILTYLKAGLLAGIVAAIINNIIYAVMITVGGFAWIPLIAVSILVASFLPNLIASVAYFILSLFSKQAYLLLAVGIIIFVLISVLPHLGIGPAPSPALAALPEGFDLVTVPLHVVFGFTAILLMPWLAKRG